MLNYFYKLIRFDKINDLFRLTEMFINMSKYSTQFLDN